MHPSMHDKQSDFKSFAAALQDVLEETLLQLQGFVPKLGKPC